MANLTVSSPGDDKSGDKGASVLEALHISNFIRHSLGVPPGCLQKRNWNHCVGGMKRIITNWMTEGAD